MDASENSPTEASAAKAPIEIRIVIAGDFKVGKTSLMHRLVDPSCPIETCVAPRPFDGSAEEMEKEVDGVKVKIFIPGTNSAASGQFKTAGGFLIVYDVTNKQTFEKSVDYIKVIKARVNDVSKGNIYLIGTKIDLERKVTTAEGEALAAEHQIKFAETSVQTLENLDTLLETLSHSVAEAMKTAPKPKVPVKHESKEKDNTETNSCRLC